MPESVNGPHCRRSVQGPDYYRLERSLDYPRESRRDKRRGGADKYKLLFIQLPGAVQRRSLGTYIYTRFLNRPLLVSTCVED